MFEIPKAKHTHAVLAKKSGTIVEIDNRYIARIAKLAGAPHCKASGVELLVKLGKKVEKGQPLYIIHAEAEGELNYALSFLELNHTVVKIEEF